MLALLVTDMQKGLFENAARYDADGVVSRIAALLAAFRKAGRPVVFVQHDGLEGDELEPGAPGWEILPAVAPWPGEPVVHKTACDAFLETDLDRTLRGLGVREVAIVGCVTDFCVDTTLRAATSLGYDVTAVSDGHTTADRAHLDAETIIAHHNWMWTNLILPGRAVRLSSAREMLAAV